MQASFYIIVHNNFSMNFSIRGSSAWWSRERMVHVSALDIQVSLRNLTAMLEDSMTSVKTLYMFLWPFYDVFHRIVLQSMNENTIYVYTVFYPIDIQSCIQIMNLALTVVCIL